MTSAAHPHPLVIGHRGASGYRPEHTAEAYRLAFELGADAVEPDVVLTRDGVPVVRHENEISGTTDVAAHPEFAARRTSKAVDGQALTGWFTEDFTWAELQTLRARERIPATRPASAGYDGRFGLLRLSDVLAIADEAGGGVVVELKHAHYFAGLGLPLGEIVAAELAASGWAGPGAKAGSGSASVSAGRLVIESFEKSAVVAMRAAGLAAQYVYLLENEGAPFDEVARHGAEAPSYASQLTDAGLAVLADEVDGVSLDKATVLPRDRGGNVTRASDVVDRAHRAGLSVFTWTLRAENRFLPKNLRVGTDAAALGRWEEEFALVLGAGVDGVFADQPERAVAARRAVGGAT